MTRSERLLQLIEILRCHRYPVTGHYLAAELDISLRTLYRDIATLQAQGAEIQGEAGLGYVLKPGFMLPPLMFSIEELEALVLGSHFVAGRTDEQMAKAARSALAKITTVLPTDLKRVCDETTLLMGPTSQEFNTNYLMILRVSIRQERKIQLTYKDLKDTVTTRNIWPFGVAFFDNVRLIMAYCEERKDFRHFRMDRVVKIEPMEERYPKTRHILFHEWKKTMKTL